MSRIHTFGPHFDRLGGYERGFRSRLDIRHFLQPRKCDSRLAPWNLGIFTKLSEYKLLGPAGISDFRIPFSMHHRLKGIAFYATVHDNPLEDVLMEEG